MLRDQGRGPWASACRHVCKTGCLAFHVRRKAQVLWGSLHPCDVCDAPSLWTYTPASHVSLAQHCDALSREAPLVLGAPQAFGSRSLQLGRPAVSFGALWGL